MLEIFTTNKYDNKIAVIDNQNQYTYSDIKKQITYEIGLLKGKKENIVLANTNNYDFIIHFFAAIFSNKKIYILTDKTRLNDLEIDYDILDNCTKEESSEYFFPEIDIHKPLINFFTSGSSNKPKIIKKSFYNLVKEAVDINEEFNLANQNLIFASTTTMCHRFGLTLHLIIPFINGQSIMTEPILYPENIDRQNIFLVSTPTFLSSIPKYAVHFKISPKYIASAGSKLDSKDFKFLEGTSKIIEIYGSTETGVIAYKKHFDDKFTLFKNVNIKINENNIEVITPFSYNGIEEINDNIELDNRTLIIKNRNDRLLKIYEKRICAGEIETKLKNNPLVKECYVTKNNNKLVCICALSEQGKEFLLKNNITQLTKNLRQYLSGFSETIPKRWRYTDIIPKTKIGKIDKTYIEHIFDVNLSLPIILDRELSSTGIIYKLLFYDKSNYFNGHFEEFKIVPGVVQLFVAKELANKYFNIDINYNQWKRIKFSNIIEPNDTVKLQLEKNESQITFKLYSDTKQYSCGVFLCKNIYEDKNNESF